MPGCSKCYSKYDCYECQLGLVPMFNRSGCQERIPHCMDSGHLQYGNNSQHWTCNNCEPGYFPQGEGCAKCNVSVVANCKVCGGLDTCKVCNDGFTMTPDGKKCVKFSNCGSEYGLKNGKLYCQKCDSGYTWSWDDNDCKMCTSVVPNCDSCSPMGTC